MKKIIFLMGISIFGMQTSFASNQVHFVIQKGKKELKKTFQSFFPTFELRTQKQGKKRVSFLRSSFRVKQKNLYQVRKLGAAVRGLYPAVLVTDGKNIEFAEIPVFVSEKKVLFQLKADQFLVGFKWYRKKRQEKINSFWIESDTEAGPEKLASLWPQIYKAHAKAIDPGERMQFQINDQGKPARVVILTAIRFEATGMRYLVQEKNQQRQLLVPFGQSEAKTLSEVFSISLDRIKDELAYIDYQMNWKVKPSSRAVVFQSQGMGRGTLERSYDQSILLGGFYAWHTPWIQIQGRFLGRKGSGNVKKISLVNTLSPLLKGTLRSFMEDLSAKNIEALLLSYDWNRAFEEINRVRSKLTLEQKQKWQKTYQARIRAWMQFVAQKVSLLGQKKLKDLKTIVFQNVQPLLGQKGKVWIRIASESLKDFQNLLPKQSGFVDLIFQEKEGSVKWSIVRTVDGSKKAQARYRSTHVRHHLKGKKKK